MLTNLPPGRVHNAKLLTDGTVIASDGFGNWSRLTPDTSGSYMNGTWSATIAQMHDRRDVFGSTLLADGRVFVAGGEYGTGQKTVEIYEPRRNVWTSVQGFSWNTPQGANDIGDSTAITLADKRVLLLPRELSRGQTYNPISGTWTPIGVRTL
jgi:hypothetical protein